MAVEHLDVRGAVNRFMERLDELNRLPFITDDEMRALFGEEVTVVLDEMSRLNQAKDICASCKKKCCRLVRCELYVPTLKRCPIHAYRPVLCRLHFCKEFAIDGDKSLVLELGDIFLQCLTAAGPFTGEKLTILDSPPLAAYVPELIIKVTPWITGLRESTFDETLALELINSEVSKYRMVGG